MSHEASREISVSRQVMDSSCSGVDDQIVHMKQVFGLLFVPKDKELTRNAPSYVFSLEPDLKAESPPLLQLLNDGDGVDSCVGESARWVIAELLIDLCVVKIKGE